MQPHSQGLSSYRPPRSLQGGGKMTDPGNEVASNGEAKYGIMALSRVPCLEFCAAP